MNKNNTKIPAEFNQRKPVVRSFECANINGTEQF